MEFRHSPVKGVIRRGGGLSHGGFILAGAALGGRKWGIPAHGLGETSFWGDLRQIGLVYWFKMYANGCYWEASGRVERRILLILGKITI